MSLFSNMSTDGLEQAQDRVGGFQPHESDIYTGLIKSAYAGESRNGAMSVTLNVDIGSQEYRETIYITNRQKQNYFLNKQDPSKKVPLPGFTTIDDICLIVTGSPLSEQETEEKVVKVYDVESKGEINKSVPMLTGLLNKQISLAVIKQKVNKVEKQGNEYIDTPESRFENRIEKVFHPELHVTVVEAKNDEKEAKFWDTWLSKNQGQTKDKRRIKDGQGGTAGAPPKPSDTANSNPRKSLFG